MLAQENQNYFIKVNNYAKFCCLGPENMSTKNLKLQKKMHVKNSQRMLHSSNTNEGRTLAINLNYDSPLNGNGKFYLY